MLLATYFRDRSDVDLKDTITTDSERQLVALRNVRNDQENREGMYSVHY